MPAHRLPCKYFGPDRRFDENLVDGAVHIYKRIYIYLIYTCLCTYIEYLYSTAHRLPCKYSGPDRRLDDDLVDGAVHLSRKRRNHLFANLHSLEKNAVVSCRVLALTRYCYYEYCTVDGIQKKARWEGVYCAMIVQ